MLNEDIKKKEIQELVICPHCELLIEINQINCGIFRHGVLKSNMQNIPPHLPKAQCEHLIHHNLIYGCGKPFRIIIKDDVFVAESCDYI